MSLLQVVANTEARRAPKAITDFIAEAEARAKFKELSEKGDWPHKGGGKNAPPRPVIELRNHSGTPVAIFPEAAAKAHETSREEIAKARKDGLPEPAEKTKGKAK